MASSSRYLTVANGHVDALIQFVLDYKPYHTKLSQIVEEFVFEDLINVSMVDEHAIRAYLGADITDPSYYGSSRRQATSWVQDYISDGVRKVFKTPLVTIPKLASHSSQEKFICGVDDKFQIPGIGGGVFSPRRFDGSGIATVSRNGEQLHEALDFSISHGAFSFNTAANSKWKEHHLLGLPQYAQNDGSLFYQDVVRDYGAIKNIAWDTATAEYEEWTLRCISADNLTADLLVTGSVSGPIGTATFETPFVSPSISFTFMGALADSPSIQTAAVGDTFVLTPYHKLTIHPSAPIETWTIVKVNPECVESLSITPAPSTRVGTPDIQLFTRDLHQTPASDWSIEFIDANSYVINSTLPGYPKTVALIDGCSYRDSLIHFTLIPTIGGFIGGDRIDFTIGARKPTYRVFGSISGWQPQAVELGEWYWNGKIGFKIPHLGHFANAFAPAISVSTDGVNWDVLGADDQILNEVQYVDTGSATGFLIAGANSGIGASIDGLTWKSGLAGLADDGMRSITIGQRGFVAMSTIISTTPTVTYEWHERNSRTTADLHAITHVPDFFINPPAGANGLFVVVGAQGTIITSATGDGWNISSSGTTKSLHSVAWRKNSSTSITFVAVGDDGTITTSSDALSWNLTVSPTSAKLKSVKFIEERNTFIAVGEQGVILMSADGISWTLAPTGTAAKLSDTAYRPADSSFPLGVIVATSRSGQLLRSVNGGITWTSYQSPSFNAVEFGIQPAIFVAVGGGQGPVLQITYDDADIHPMSEASVYTITFVSSTNAIVTNNVYGNRRGLVINEPWTDGMTSFVITDTPNNFLRGDVVKVNIAHKYEYALNTTYDSSAYDEGLYDTYVSLAKLPLEYDENYFHLVHSDSAIILDNCNPGDVITIDKTVFERVQIRLPNATNGSHPLLGAKDGWVPLEFRVFDGASSTAQFPDLATSIAAYLSSDPDYLVFTIDAPRYEYSNKNSSCILTFSDDFVSDYLTLGTEFTIKAVPYDSYGQKIKVRMTENLRVYARVSLNFNDIVLVNVDELMGKISETASTLNFNDIMLVDIVEGGIIPFYAGYDVLPYEMLGYENRAVYLPLYGVVEGPPGTYTYTGIPTDVFDPAARFSGAPGIIVNEQPSNETTGAAIAEGLKIAEHITVGAITSLRLHYTYKQSKYTAPIVLPTLIDGLQIDIDAGEYVITHDWASGTPALIVQSEANPAVILNPTPVTNTYSQIPTATSSKSFTFTVPPGTAPFRLRLA